MLCGGCTNVETINNGARGSPDYYLFHLRPTVLVDLLPIAFCEHLLTGVDVHGDFEEGFVEEGDARLEAPGHRGPENRSQH